jgi:2-polyprenyl-6-methoxyphenol hydroxylase-like FAD-dependent oxidoreductase
MPRRCVVVIGAGPAGAALSLLLARRGVEVILVEREPSLERVFRGEALMPSGIDAIRQLGLADAFARLPQVVVPFMELHVDRRRVVRADWPELSGDNAPRAVSQPALIGMLVEQAASAGMFDLRLAATVRDITPRPGGVDVVMRAAGQDTTIRADAVVGADGRSSTTRARAGITLQRIAFPGDVAWLLLPAPQTQRDDPRFQAFAADGASVILYPSWDGRIRVGVNVPRAASAPSRRDILDTVAAVAGEPYAAIARAADVSIADPIVLKVLVGRAPRWSFGRVLLIGDAAHPMAPVRAQGINLALRDAIVAANHLGPALAAGDEDAIAAAGMRVQAEREPEVVEIQRLQQAAMGLPPLMRSPVLRSTLLPLLRRAGVVKRMMLKSEVPLRHGVAEVKLAV